MPLFLKLRKIVARHFMEMRWYSLVLATVFYVVSSWLLLVLCNEKALTQADNFIYWLLVTGSTVGYGDYSPETTAGKWLVALYIIPFGLGLFGILLGRLAAFFSYQWRKGVRGLSQMNHSNHIVIIGWNESRTLQLIRLLQHEISHGQEQDIVLCVVADVENPLPDEIGFVKVMSFTHDEDMQRANISEAATIILDNPDDDTTLATALYVSSKNPNAHIIAYFKHENMGELLRKHCPKVECAPSVAVELIAKSAMDPGSSALHHQLLNVHDGMTQYSAQVGGDKPLTVEQAFMGLKKHYDATLIAIAECNADVQLNPSWEQKLSLGDCVYYIADERICDIDWGLFDV